MPKITVLGRVIVPVVDQDDDEDRHLDQSEHSHRVQSHGPREDEHRLHVEHHEEEGEDVVPHVAL